MGYLDSLNESPTLGKIPGSDAPATQDLGTRVSPTARSDERGKTFQEIMVKMSIKGINIDIDRDGGVFLDHNELAALIERGDIDGVISDIQNAIAGAKLQYTQQPPANFRWNG